MLKKSILLLCIFAFLSFSLEGKADDPVKVCAVEDIKGSWNAQDGPQRICTETCGANNWAGRSEIEMSNPDPDCVNAGINTTNSICYCNAPSGGCWSRWKACTQGCSLLPGGKGACDAGCDATVRECITGKSSPKKPTSSSQKKGKS